jgi:uncharacterized protein YbbC (DUF1343 family)
MKHRSFTFTPESRSGAKNPPLKGKLCQGVDLSNLSTDEIVNKGIDLSYVIDAYKDLSIGDKFFADFFEKLIGVSWVRTMIEQGSSAEEIRACWQSDVQRFKEERKPFLLYEE